MIAAIPFVALLLCIAILPIAAPHLWEKNRSRALVAAGLSLPVVVLLARTHRLAALGHALTEYAQFVCLLGSLYIVSGGIHIEGDLEGTPRTNAVTLAIGAVLASLIGTTGASAVLIRFLLRTNSQRKNTGHIPLFFILIVSNAGGLLTPLGDPPLFLGYLRGVPFLWTLRLAPVWLATCAFLIAVFAVVDSRAYRRETSATLQFDAQSAKPVRVRGLANVGLLLGILASVFAPTPYREGAMVVLTLLSLGLTSRAPREANKFTFAPIIEVAILFLGIFITMIPALELLSAHASTLGLTSAVAFFWATGLLSSVLDNAPTYVSFLEAARALALESEVAGIPHRHLEAISIGAVLMGANTYIGNGPNFMVKAISEESGYPMPSFGRYALIALGTMLVPYLGVTLYLAFAP